MAKVSDFYFRFHLKIAGSSPVRGAYFCFFAEVLLDARMSLVTCIGFLFWWEFWTPPAIFQGTGSATVSAAADAEILTS